MAETITPEKHFSISLYLLLICKFHVWKMVSENQRHEFEFFHQIWAKPEDTLILECFPIHSNFANFGFKSWQLNAILNWIVNTGEKWFSWHNFWIERRKTWKVHTNAFDLPQLRPTIKWWNSCVCWRLRKIVARTFKH